MKNKKESMDPREQEIELVRELFGIEQVLDFQSEHDMQINRESDWQYMCYIDGKGYASALTPMGAIVFGIIQFKNKQSKPDIWIKVEDMRPTITEENPFVTVDVLTEHGGTGEMSFGFSGAMGEPIDGSFWQPIRNFEGDVHYENKIIAWRPKISQ